MFYGYVHFKWTEQNNAVMVFCEAALNYSCFIIIDIQWHKEAYFPVYYYDTMLWNNLHFYKALYKINVTQYNMHFTGILQPKQKNVLFCLLTLGPSKIQWSLVIHKMQVSSCLFFFLKSISSCTNLISMAPNNLLRSCEAKLSESEFYLSSL